MSEPEVYRFSQDKGWVLKKDASGIRESWVKDQVKLILGTLGIWYFMPQGTGMGMNGIPDFICCKQGVFVGIETKCLGGRVTALQLHRMGDIVLFGGHCMLVDEYGLRDLYSFLENLSYITPTFTVLDFRRK